MESKLTAPLLSDNPVMSSSEWPSAVGERVKLCIPSSYDPYQEGEPGKCFLRFDEERKLLLLVSEATDETLDIIDPEDLIGAAVEVELLGSANTELRSTTTNHSFQNVPTGTPEGQVSPAGGGIFKPLGEDAEKIFSVCNNEPASNIPFDTQAVAVLTLYSYPQIDPSKQSTMSCGPHKPKPNKDYVKATNKSKLGHRYAHHRRFQVAPAEDFSDVSTLVRAIRKICRPSPQKRDRLLVIINPFSGRKTGEEIYKTVVDAMLKQADVDHDNLITTRGGEAEERMMEQPKDSSIPDISDYDGIVAIGGDGTVYELFQGIKKRKDSDKILKKMKFGHIGGGTSNGLCKSLVHASDAQHSPIDYAFQVAKGQTVKMDLSRYETKSSSYLSFLTFSWSIIADIDIESECLRWLGSLRMDVWGVWRVLNLKKYPAKLSYLPPSENTELTLPPLNEPIPKEGGWKTIEDNFVIFWASQVTHAGEAMFHSPHTKIDDGMFQIFIVRGNVSRLRLALVLIAMEHGGHVGMEEVEFIQCKAYRLEPGASVSSNDLDGEVIESGPVQGIVLPGAFNAYCCL